VLCTGIGRRRLAKLITELADPQDAYAYRCDGRHVVVAVADGVGSGRLSHVASNIVTQHGCQLVTARLATTPAAELDWGEILEVMAKKVLNAGRRRMSVAADDPPPAFADVARLMSTTILFVVLEMMPRPDGHLTAYVMAHGDTSAWILRHGRDAWEPLQAVKNASAEVATSATAALPYVPASRPDALVLTVGPQDVLLLASDGIGDPLSDGAGPVGAFLADRWRTAPEPLAFAAHVDFARRSHDDDRTAVALWPGPHR
jgi:serine/threonine protein phosphatase PrpC